MANGHYLLHNNTVSDRYVVHCELTDAQLKREFLNTPQNLITYNNWGFCYASQGFTYVNVNFKIQKEFEEEEWIKDYKELKSIVDEYLIKKSLKEFLS